MQKARNQTLLLFHSNQIAGFNESGQFGSGESGSATKSNIPTAISTATVSTWKQLAVGLSHACGIALADDVGYCWGTSYQLYKHHTICVCLCVCVFVCGTYQPQCSYSSCAGSNSDGQLGDNTVDSRLYPTAIDTSCTVSAWKQLIAGNSYSCGIASNDVGYCWGRFLLFMKWMHWTPEHTVGRC